MGNGRVIFRVVAGGYLAYLGITLLMDSIKDKPDNYMWFMLAGAFFTLVGGFWLIRSIVSHFKGDTANQMNEEETETEVIEAESVERESIETEAIETESIETEEKEPEESEIKDKEE